MRKNLAPASLEKKLTPISAEVEPDAPRQMHDGSSPIAVKASTWEERHDELWDLLVPSSGPAATIQGEVIRIAGRISHEMEHSGGTNWDLDFTKMTESFIELLQTGAALPEPALNVCKEEVASIIEGGGIDTDPLMESAVAWVLLNPQPVPLGEVKYSM